MGPREQEVAVGQKMFQIRVPFKKACGKIEWEECSGGDLNPHALRHTPLKRTCLPFHHPSLWGSL